MLQLVKVDARSDLLAALVAAIPDGVVVTAASRRCQQGAHVAALRVVDVETAVVRRAKVKRDMYAVGKGIGISADRGRVHCCLRDVGVQGIARRALVCA